MSATVTRSGTAWKQDGEHVKADSAAKATQSTDKMSEALLKLSQMITNL